MAPRFRVVVVGCGDVSQLWFPAVGQKIDADIVGIVELDRECAGSAIERYELSCDVYADLEQAVESADANLVVNLTPPRFHRAMVETALELGCDVLGEKPIALSLTDACALVVAADRAEKTYAVMQNQRYLPGIQTLRDRLAAGGIGVPTFFSVDVFAGLHSPGFREEMDSPLLLDMGIHTFDAVRFVAGVEPVAASCHEFNPPGSWYAGNAAAVCVFEFTDGSVLSYRGSWVAEGFTTPDAGLWRINGTLGTAIWDGEGSPICEVGVPPPEPRCSYPVHRSEWHVSTQPPPRDRSGHAACIDAMLDALRDGRRPMTDCSDNVKSLAMVLAGIRSARERRRVEIEELLGSGSPTACAT
jgi:predicted dehydrogenase